MPKAEPAVLVDTPATVDQLELGGVKERRGWLHVKAGANTKRYGVTVIGETAQNYRVRNDSDVRLRLDGPFRYVAPGQITKVPKTAITFDHL